MVDQTNLPSDKDEYKFNESEVLPQVEEGDPETTAFQDETSVSRGVNLKRFYLPGTIVLAILSIYLVSSFLSARKARDLELQKITAQGKSVISQPIMSSPPMVAPSERTQEIDDEITKMEGVVKQGLDEVAQKLSDDDDEISDLGKAVAVLQNDISAVSQNVGHVAEAMSLTLREIQDMREAAKKAKIKKKVSKPRIAYNIRAIVPGRVWLESAIGKAVTLRVGDKLEGYGEVEIISPRQGMVLMSGGSALQYGANDF